MRLTIPNGLIMASALRQSSCKVYPCLQFRSDIPILDTREARRTALFLKTSTHTEHCVTHIMENLLTDHRNMSVLLDVLDQEISVYSAENAPDFETVTCILEYCVDYPEHYHHPNEEALADRLILRDPSYNAILASLTNEHAEIATMTKQFADHISIAIAEPDSLNQAVVDYGRKFTAFYRAHMVNEESTLFAQATETLTDDDWKTIEATCALRPDPLFDDHIQDAYRALHQRIVQRAKKSRTASAS